jgi:uncharacterized protein DUF1844
MAEDAPSFEVRERRRFKDTAATESGSEKTEEAGQSGAAPEAEGTKKAVAGTEDSPAASVETDRADDRSSSEVGEPTGQEEPHTPDPQPDTDAGSGANADGEPDSGSGMPDISVFGVLQFTVGTLSQLAWQGMGLIANSATGKLDLRMAEARMAIDALRALVPVMSPSLDESSRRELQTLLSNLQLNYVEQAKRRES